MSPINMSFEAAADPKMETTIGGGVRKLSLKRQAVKRRSQRFEKQVNKQARAAEAEKTRVEEDGVNKDTDVECSLDEDAFEVKIVGSGRARRNAPS